MVFINFKYNFIYLFIQKKVHVSISTQLADTMFIKINCSEKNINNKTKIKNAKIPLHKNHTNYNNKKLVKKTRGREWRYQYDVQIQTKTVFW